MHKLYFEVNAERMEVFSSASKSHIFYIMLVFDNSGQITARLIE